MADVYTNIEAQVREALDMGEVSAELEQYLALGNRSGLSDRDRKLLLILEDAINSGQVHRFARLSPWAS